MECSFEKKDHFRHFLFFAFNQDSKAAKAARDICIVCGEGAIAERTARDWYAKFKFGNFHLKDAPLSVPPMEYFEVRLNQLLHRKFMSNVKRTGRENGMLPHCCREASSLDEKDSEVWSMSSVCFQVTTAQINQSVPIWYQWISTSFDLFKPLYTEFRSILP
ncbi:histone-lysine N-methyltransferase SETMAR [Nephila pilipes]|uniref:Histone-lysine N-methyltransferase SETMAR n=1 Tax=Nephila pilipes TaxID=299642 RepID=A0A8X6JBF2_NEPPI|nr:histone-lysine N-methyltransferase SETMAR [Nephila pilipes]